MIMVKIDLISVYTGCKVYLRNYIPWFRFYLFDTKPSYFSRGFEIDLLSLQYRAAQSENTLLHNSDIFMRYSQNCECELT